jgi:long-subunit acyl-CoA synthetase (AMP-forming)
MKTALLLLLLSTASMAQNLSPEEQKNLIEENKMLREELKKLQNEQKNPNSSESMKMMEALKRGQKFQEEQNKALEELDKED